MRTLETLLLLSNLLAFCGLAIPRLRAARWRRLPALVAVAIALAHWVLEGPRWQMVPAYGLTLLIFVISMVQRFSAAGGTGAKGWRQFIAIGIGVAAFAMSSALPVFAPVFTFPPPTGPYAIGTLTYHWVDTARVEAFTGGSAAQRELMVQIWYPARSDATAPRADYLPEAGAVTAAFARIHHVLVGLDLAQFQATVGQSYLPRAPGSPPTGIPIPPGLALQGGSIITYLALDVVFALDQLAALNRADPNGILTGKLNLQSVGAFGISLGGSVVGESCRREPRLRACLMMDAPMSNDVVRAGLRQPSMWITRNAESMRLERRRAGGWPEAEIEAHLTSMRAVYEGLSGPGYFVRVPGMFHSNFTDIASWTPLASLIGMAGTIDSGRAHVVVNVYSQAFFDRHLLGRPSKLLAQGAAGPYPEAHLESRRP